ncbi:hypothetical protein [Clostridium ganghwense]|uniref:Phage head morphogenesis domain-containing protein n=1 Tax=Clostridium ganghwense TaxID=312089 RepID=A0ABT4CTQ5_9CLOT|nr:hypothetical protein [Clostridium ganghwense]MCY6372455.1 hypothetical protein [Clostridium ganghwense]
MNLYQQTVLESRKKFLKLTLKQEKEVLNIYKEAAKEITERLAKSKAGSLKQRQLSELQKTIKQYTRELQQQLSKSIKEGIKASVEIASNVQLSYFETMDLHEDLSSTFRKMFTQLNVDVAKTIVSGDYYKDGLTLDKRIWNITKRNGKDLNRIIKVNTVQRRSAGELAKQLEQYINPKKKMITHTRVPGINKSIAYQSQRLARTSLTHSNTESYIQGSKKNPFCEGFKWNLSPSHSLRMHGRTDICDEYAGKIFEPDECPIQHPNCLCYFTQETIPIEQAREELIEWVNGGENAKLDKWIGDYGQEFGIGRR